MTNREYLKTLTSYDISKYMLRLVREKAIISDDGIIKMNANWLDAEHTEEYDKEKFIA